MVLGIDQRRIKRREVRSPGIKPSFEGTEGGVDAEASEQKENRKDLNPPRVMPLRSTETANLNQSRRLRHEAPSTPEIRLAGNNCLGKLEFLSRRTTAPRARRLSQNGTRSRNRSSGSRW